MKNLKVLLLAATFACANIAIAQQNAVSKKAPTNQVEKKVYQTPEEHAAKQTERLTTACGLTAEQQVKVKPIYLESNKAIEASNKVAGKDKDKAKADKTRLILERRKKIALILTPDQKAKFDALTKDGNDKNIDADER